MDIDAMTAEARALKIRARCIRDDMQWIDDRFAWHKADAKARDLESQAGRLLKLAVKTDSVLETEPVWNENLSGETK